MIKLKILLVDDQEISNFINKKIIGLSEVDCDVYAFTDPVEAFSQLNELQPDIILLDLQMPVLNGWQFLYKMVEHSLQYPVAIITSSTSPEDQQRSKGFAHVVDYCVKPIQTETVLQLTQKLAKAVV